MPAQAKLKTSDEPTVAARSRLPLVVGDFIGLTRKVVRKKTQPKYVIRRVTIRGIKTFLQIIWTLPYSNPLSSSDIAELFNFLGNAGLSETELEEVMPALEPHAPKLVRAFSQGLTIDTDVRSGAKTDNEPNRRPLTIPEGDIPKYQGRATPDNVYDFLMRVYPYTEGGTPLTLSWLRTNDEKAHRAFYNRRRIVPLPDCLEGLTRPDGDDVLAQHGLDLASADGEAQARRLMNVINARLYPRNER